MQWGRFPRHWRLMAVAVLAWVVAGGCGFNLLSTQQEIAIGERVAADIGRKVEPDPPSKDGSRAPRGPPTTKPSSSRRRSRSPCRSTAGSARA